MKKLKEKEDEEKKSKGEKKNLCFTLVKSYKSNMQGKSASEEA